MLDHQLAQCIIFFPKLSWEVTDEESVLPHLRLPCATWKIGTLSSDSQAMRCFLEAINAFSGADSFSSKSPEDAQLSHNANTDLQQFKASDTREGEEVLEVKTQETEDKTQETDEAFLEAAEAAEAAEDA